MSKDIARYVWSRRWKMNDNKEGWAHVNFSRKWHYFVDGRSLCRSYGVFPSVQLEQGNDESPDNCAICMKKLAKRKAEEVNK